MKRLTVLNPVFNTPLDQVDIYTQGSLKCHWVNIDPSYLELLSPLLNSLIYQPDWINLYMMNRG